MNETCISKLPRFQPIDRTQILLRTTDVESLIAEDHPARAIWIFLSRLDLSKFSEEQRAVEGDVGRSAISPHLLLSIWIYSYTRGVSSARQISREMEHEPGLQWLAGMQVVNHSLRKDCSAWNVLHKTARRFARRLPNVAFSTGNISSSVLISPNATSPRWTAWQTEYNEQRPHSSLGYLTPKEFATAMRAAEAGSALLATPSSA